MTEITKSAVILIRRGEESGRLGIIPREGELIVTTDTHMLYVGDGSTPGGISCTGDNILNVVTKTNDYSLINTDDVVIVDGTSNSVNIDLPSAISNRGKVFYIKAVNISNIVRILSTTGGNIDGSSSYTFIQNNETIRVISDGSNWFII